jgi:hypothetical protein
MGEALERGLPRPISMVCELGHPTSGRIPNCLLMVALRSSKVKDRSRGGDGILVRCERRNRLRPQPDRGKLSGSAVSPSEQQFMRAVQLLAAPPDAQVAHYPAFVAVGTELALGFNETARRFLADVSCLTELQRRTVDTLDAALDELPGSDAGRTWADRDAVIHDPRWAEIRARAVAVLEAFGWPLEVPPRGDTIYIEGLGMWPER